MINRTYLVSLVTEEMDLFKSFIFHVAKCIRFVPARREHIKGDLATNGVREPVGCKILLEGVNEFLANLVLLTGTLFNLIAPSN